ncbi:MAG: TIGR02391 family protein [Actinomycetota bacterium]
MPNWDDVALNLARALRAIAPPPEPEFEVPGEPPPPVADPLGLFDQIVTDPELVAVARSLFEDGYYALSVEEATKFVNNLVKNRSGSGLDGAKLMSEVFLKEKPLLRVNDLKTQSKLDQQKGYGLILQGTMIGVRNPRAHEHAYLDEPHNALEILALCNHVVRVIRKATRTRSRRPKAP